MNISTLLENFLSYDDAATITEDVSAILSCPVLVGEQRLQGRGLRVPARL